MGAKQEIQQLQTLVKDLMISLDKERSANERLREMCYRHESQLARAKMNDTESAAFRRAFSDLIFNDNRETAISIFSWEGLPETPLNLFNSKRIESQIFNFAPVCIFEHEITMPNGKREKCPLILPFVPASPALDCYGEFPVIRPYSPNGLTGETGAFALSDANPFKELIVGEECVIISDYFEWGQTNGNTSMSIRAAVRFYSDLMAECENAKRVNRNWIKIPLLFNTDGTEDNKQMNALINEVNAIVGAVKDSEDALITKYAKNLQILNTGVIYYGKELEDCIKDYQNKLWNFLGIGHIFNENRAQKVTAEFEKTQDEYNINIIKRLQLREKGTSEAKNVKTLEKYFRNAKLRVNLQGFATAYSPEAVAAESNQSTRKETNQNAVRK